MKAKVARALRRIADRLDPTPVQRAGKIIDEYISKRPRATKRGKRLKAVP